MHDYAGMSETSAIAEQLPAIASGEQVIAEQASRLRVTSIQIGHE